MKRIINKSISIIISLTVMFVLIGSTVFIVKHIGHHCEDKNCPVCIELANCHNNILQLGSTCAAVCNFTAFVTGYIAYGIYTVFSVPDSITLISLKVELLN